MGARGDFGQAGVTLLGVTGVPALWFSICVCGMCDWVLAMASASRVCGNVRVSEECTCGGVGIWYAHG